MQPPEGPAAHAVERVYREEYGRILATLIRVFGDFDLAEDALQEAFISAVDRWPTDGNPDNPAAWLTTAARNKALSRLRREHTQSKLRDQVKHELEAGILIAPDEPDLLRLIFIPYRVPPDYLMPERLASVLAVVYLVFNDGGTSSRDLMSAYAASIKALRPAKLRSAPGLTFT